jgi:hypothetical protein
MGHNVIIFERTEQIAKKKEEEVVQPTTQKPSQDEL